MPIGPSGARQIQRATDDLTVNRDQHAPGQLVTFLFADIRGYTRFTERRGAEAAAGLAGRFARHAEEVCAGHSGRVRGSWGDQVLVEFASPRDAVRAAVGLQVRLLDETLADPAWPLPVGIGLDVGEPAEVGVSRSASALNVAARLCDLARAGEVLASAELVHLAGVVEHVTYVDRGSARFKGLSQQTRIVQVRPVPADDERHRRFQSILRDDFREPPKRRRRVWTAAVAAVAVVAGLVGWTTFDMLGSTKVVIPHDGVAVVDPGSGRLVDAVRVGGSPGAVAAGAGAVWVARSADNGIVRLPTSNRATTVVAPESGATTAFAVSRRDLWTVSDTDRFVRRINLAVGREVDRIEVGNQLSAVATGAGWLWVTSKTDSTLTRIDPSGRQPPKTVHVGRGPRGIAVSDGTVWVTNGSDGTVSPVDAQTMEVGAPIPVGAGPRGIVVAQGSAWVANSLELTVSRIDLGRRATVATLPVGESPTSIAGAAGSIWVSVSGDGVLARIDPAAGRVDARLALGASPYGLAAADGRLWIATRPFASAAHRGGTLTVADCCSALDARSWDPAFSNLPPTAMFSVYDGLVALRKAAGADGFDLVPDLARSLPEPTDGGRTYTFTLRRGIRYSDGRPVRPADFRRGLTRAFTAAGGNAAGLLSPGPYLAMVGVEACGRSPVADARCDLSAGITSGRDTVTFHLSRPDPDFLSKLALSLAAPAPPGSPAGPLSGTQTLPGTGPYRVAQISPGRSVLLTRNPHFRVWSVAAQPPVYPDRVRFVSVEDRDRAVRAVLDGAADVTSLGGVSGERLQRLEVNYPELVHRDQFAFTWFLQLNTREPPFNDLTARRALAYALDRTRFDGGYGAGGEPACHLIPPGFLGYDPSCTYTTSPDRTGEWYGPDFARARQLVEQSGTTGDRVVVWWWDAVPADGRYLTRLLRRLGYDAQLRLRSGDEFWNGVFDPETPKNVSANGWIADIVSPSSFYQPLVSCADGPGDYCNPALDRLAASALAAQNTDPGLADRRWRQVFATINAEAAVIPLIHGDQYVLVSSRTGNFASQPLHGAMLGQMWVR